VVSGPRSSWPFPDTRAFAGSAPALTLSASPECHGDQACDPDRVQDQHYKRVHAHAVWMAMPPRILPTATPMLLEGAALTVMAISGRLVTISTAGVDDGAPVEVWL
jgi:hypothetical protein